MCRHKWIEIHDSPALQPVRASEQVTPSGGGEWTVERVLSILGGNVATAEVKRLTHEINQSLQKISPDNNKPRKKKPKSR